MTTTQIPGLILFSALALGAGPAISATGADSYLQSVYDAVVGRPTSPSDAVESHLCAALEFRLGWSCPGPAIRHDLSMPYFLDRINAVRGQARRCGAKQMPAVPALRWSWELQNAAIAAYIDMRDAHYFGHRNPSTGRDARAWAADAGWAGAWVQDDLAAGHLSEAAAIDAWLADPPHCEPIMDPRATDFGGYFTPGGKGIAYFGWEHL